MTTQSNGDATEFTVPGKIAVVTGASSGIGQATARHLANLGMVVIAVARREDRLAALAEESPLIHARRCDVAETDDVDALAGWVKQEFGACHVLINNAGVGGGPFRGRDDLDDALRTIEINLNGVLRTLAAFADLLEHSAPSRVINVASVSGKIGVGPAAYCASKFGVVGVSESLALAWKSRGITVAQLNPGYIETEGFPQEQVKRGPMASLVGKPKDVAVAIEAVIRSGATERTVPRWYKAVVSLRHTAPPLFWSLISRTERSQGTRE